MSELYPDDVTECEYCGDANGLECICYELADDEGLEYEPDEVDLELLKKYGEV